MKIVKKTVALIAAAAMGISIAVPSSATLKTVKAAPDEYHDDWLHCEGSKIYDMNGNEVWLTGANWFGYNVGSQVFDGVWSQNMHSMLKQIADHGINLLRVPMSSEIILQWKNGDPDPATPKVNAYENPELTEEGIEGGTIKYSLDIWNMAVKWCRELGIKIMIDIHSAETNSAGHQIPVWYTDKISEDQWIESLEWLAETYKDDDTLIALDLKNEPHGKVGEGNVAIWNDSDDKNNWKRAAEKAGKAVLDINPNLLVMVEGNEVYPKDGKDWTQPNIDYARYPYSPYYGTWWGGNFRGEKDYPVDLGKYQGQLVFSPHDYGPLVYEQEWFKGDFTYDSLMKDVWHDNWFFIKEENIAPLLIGEWGGFMDSQHDADGKNVMWMTDLRELITKYHINHTFWCFNENSGDTGGLVYDNFGKWDEQKYNFLKEALWQEKNGKFIGLSHTTPLGANGVSLNQHYGSKKNQSLDDVQTSDETQKAPDFVLGDLNGDKKVNVKDLTLLKQGAFERYHSSIAVSATNTEPDINCNGVPYEVSDVVLLQKFILGDISSLKTKELH